MSMEIVTEPLSLDIYGFGASATNKDYAGTAFRLSGKMWDIVKANNLKNKGLNVWVYGEDHNVFAGVELNETPNETLGLEHMKIGLPKYAYYKHIGPYNLIGKAGQNMRDELKSKGYETTLPYIEIYGHWTNDESKLETELLVSLK